MSATQDALQVLAHRIKVLGLEVFSGCGSMTRDAIEWFAAELSVSELALGDVRSHFICLCPDCVKPKVEAFHLNTDKTVAVGDHEFYDMDTCPRNVKVLLLGPGEVATLGNFDGDPQWLGWFPVPKKRKKT